MAEPIDQKSRKGYPPSEPTDKPPELGSYTTSQSLRPGKVAPETSRSYETAERTRVPRPAVRMESADLRAIVIAPRNWYDNTWHTVAA